MAELDFALNTPELKNDFEVRVALVVALHRAGQRARACTATRTLATGVWANAARTVTPPIPCPTIPACASTSARTRSTPTTD